MRDPTHSGAPHRINSQSVAMTLETLHMQGASGVSGPEHVARAVRASAHIEAVHIVWPRCRFTRRSLVRRLSAITGLRVFFGCQKGLARAIGVAADGLSKWDDHYDLGHTLDTLQGLRFHMGGSGRCGCRETACECCT